jgi:mannose-6-phosphate isomerase-like protein (cupin superfamily)
MSDTLKLTPSESLVVRSSRPELLEVEATYGPTGKPPPSHLHSGQDEHFEVLAGSVTTRVAGRERALGRGETIDIPRGTPHQMWNAGDEPARVLWRTRPAGRTEEWFRAIDSLHREGRVGRGGMPGPLAFGALLTEYRDVFRLAVGPEPLVRPLLAALGVLGRARGYRFGGSARGESER